MTTNNRFPDILNPFAELIQSGIEIRNALAESVQQLELALENEATKRRIAKEYREEYEATEAEFVAEKIMALTGKNAESRKAELDAALIAVRNGSNGNAGNYMAHRWQLLNQATWDHEDAKVALEQAAKRFRATEAAADLTAAMLRAAMG